MGCYTPNLHSTLRVFGLLSFNLWQASRITPPRAGTGFAPVLPSLGTQRKSALVVGLLGIATMVNQQSGVSFNLLCLVVTEINLRDVGMTIPLDSFMF